MGSSVCGREEKGTKEKRRIPGSTRSKSAEAARAGHLMNIPPDNDPPLPGKVRTCSCGYFKDIPLYVP